MAPVVVELPTEHYEQLKQRAAAAGKSPEALSREILETFLGANVPCPAAAAEASAPPPPTAS